MVDFWFSNSLLKAPPYGHCSLVKPLLFSHAAANFPCPGVHYKNLPMQYRKKFGCKNENFHWKIFDIFLIFAQNIDCGYTLEPPRRGGSNEYPQSIFWSKNKKNRYTPAYPSFSI